MVWRGWPPVLNHVVRIERDGSMIAPARFANASVSRLSTASWGI
jgi:hypothetical protein